MNPMKTILMGCLLFTICSGCQMVPTDPQIQSTNITYPELDSPGIDSCEDVNGICLELTFDGETCKYERPNELD